MTESSNWLETKKCVSKQIRSILYTLLGKALVNVHKVTGQFFQGKGTTHLRTRFGFFYSPWAKIGDITADCLYDVQIRMVFSAFGVIVVYQGGLNGCLVVLYNTNTTGWNVVEIITFICTAVYNFLLMVSLLFHTGIMIIPAI